MNLRPLFLLNLLVLLSTFQPGMAQLVEIPEFEPTSADTILLERNWRTRSGIILSELEFIQGDTVTRDALGISLKKIWNLQNFASVRCRWDTLPDGRSALVIAARDAITVRPVIAGWLGTSEVATLKLGLADRNFLGRNIGLEVRGQISRSDPFYGELKITIPRQLLWKNLVVGFGARSERIPGSLTANQAYINLTNPFHTDYRYTFSPDIEAGFLHQQSVPGTGEPAETFNHPFWYVRIAESFGTVTHRRHQEEGFCLTVSGGGGLGLTGGTAGYAECRIRAEYHALVSPRLQFSATWEGWGQTSVYPGLWPRLGPADLRGIRYGEVTGPLMQLVTAGWYQTWLNADWLALEQSVYLQFAAASGPPVSLWPSKRQLAIGTGLRFTIPMYPAASILVSVNFNPGSRDWFYMEL